MANRIQCQVYQECRNGGCTFVIVPFTPDGDINNYTFSWFNSSGNGIVITQLSSNSFVIENNQPNTQTTHVQVTVSRAGYNDFVYDAWSNTCDHDDMPTSCPENGRSVSTNSDSYNIGDTIIADWGGSFFGCVQSMSWYNQNISATTQSGTHFEGIVTGYPAILHGQPNHNNQTCKECHGWTEKVFTDPSLDSGGTTTTTTTNNNTTTTTTTINCPPDGQLIRYEDIGTCTACFIPREGVRNRPHRIEVLTNGSCGERYGNVIPTPCLSSEINQGNVSCAVITTTTTTTTSTTVAQIVYYNNPVNIPPCETTQINKELIDVSENDLIDIGYTMSYYPDLDSWLSYHDYIPSGIFATRNKVLSFDDKQIYIHNQDNFAKYYKGIVYKSIITPVFQSPYRDNGHYYPAWYYQINWLCDIIKDKLVQRNKTLTKISLHNSYQSTKDTLITPFDTSKSFKEQYDLFNTRLVKNHWNFNKFRDLIIDHKILTFEEWTELEEIVFSNDIDEMNIDIANTNSNKSFELKRRFIDEYLIVKMEYNNEEQLQILLYEVLAETLIANR